VTVCLRRSCRCSRSRSEQEGLDGDVDHYWLSGESVYPIGFDFGFEVLEGLWFFVKSYAAGLKDVEQIKILVMYLALTLQLTFFATVIWKL
jgi:hypothetical protein